eukprot:m51a1_g28 putative protein kinase domain containing protein (2458) ;mRNA; r:113976-122755
MSTPAPSGEAELVYVVFEHDDNARRAMAYPRGALVSDIAHLALQMVQDKYMRWLNVSEEQLIVVMRSAGEEDAEEMLLDPAKHLASYAPTAETELVLRVRKLSNTRVTRKKRGADSLKLRTPRVLLRSLIHSMQNLDSRLEEDRSVEVHGVVKLPPYFVQSLQQLESYLCAPGVSPQDVFSLFAYKATDKEMADIRALIDKEDMRPLNPAVSCNLLFQQLRQFCESSRDTLVPRDAYELLLRHKGSEEEFSALGAALCRLSGVPRLMLKRVGCAVSYLCSRGADARKNVTAFITITKHFMLSVPRGVAQQSADAEIACLEANFNDVLDSLLFCPESSDKISRIPGERTFYSLDNVVFSNWRPITKDSGVTGLVCCGELWMTNYRLVHLSPIGLDDDEAAQVPLKCIHNIEEVGLLQLRVQCKDFRVFYLFFPCADPAFVQRSLEMLRRLCEDGAETFAFINRELPAVPGDWAVYKPPKDLARMKTPQDAWRISKANESYALSASYPSQLISTSPATVAKRCEEYLGHSHFVVVDTGSGVPVMSVLPLNLATPESIRQAFDEMLGKDAEGAPHPTRKSPFVGMWTDQMKKVLSAASIVAGLLKKHNVILQHARDYADTDAQISSVVQLLLDPYYRTTKGHALDNRAALSCCSLRNSCDFDGKSPSFSPVFLQFCFVVWSLMQEFPTAFEFREELLFFVANASLTERYGNFLNNFEWERQRVRGVSVSAWSQLLRSADDYKNSLYTPRADPLAPATDREPMMWFGFLLQWNIAAIEGVRKIRAQIRSKANKAQTAIPLSSLSAAFNRLFFVPPFVYSIYGVSSIDLSFNTLNTIPPRLAVFNSLQTLSLAYAKPLPRLSTQAPPNRHNDIVWMPPEVVSLLATWMPLLEGFDISGNCLTGLADEVVKFQKLKGFCLGGNKIPAWPAVLDKMETLTELSVGQQSFSQFPAMPFKPQLLLLDASGMELSHVPTFFTQMGSLTTLTLSDNVLTDLPDTLFDMKMLKTLNLQNNRFLEFPRALLNLWWLENLDLSKNKIVDLPPDINCLSSLKYFNLSANCVRGLPSAIAQLYKLEMLDLKSNYVTEVPLAVGLLPNLRFLDLTQNEKIAVPPLRVAESGPMASIEYLRTQLGGDVLCLRVRVMVVGANGVGKTTLVRCLRERRRITGLAGPDYNMSTDGIHIDDWQVPLEVLEVDEKTGESRQSTLDVAVNVWDFAGQSVYYTTHQFFLSDRAIALVVWDMSRPFEESMMEHWLWNLRTHAPSVPVLIVGTHRDKFPSSVFKPIADQIYEAFHPHFPSIIGVFPVSCPTYKGINKLRESLEDALRAHPYLRQEVPGRYLLLEKSLRETFKASAQPVLNWAGLREIAARCSIEGDADLEEACTVLHHFGVLLHYESEPLLRDMVVLKPQWLVDLFATLFTVRENYASKGILSTRDLPQIWRLPKYPPEFHASLVALLESFEVVYNLTKNGAAPKATTSSSGTSSASSVPPAAADEQMLLVPALLPEPRPQEIGTHWPQLSEDVRILNFPGMVAKLYWKNGMLATMPSSGATVLLEQRPGESTVICSARGTSPVTLARLMYDTISSLMSDSLAAEMQIYVPCTHCILQGLTHDKWHLFTIEQCELAAFKGTPFLYCRGESPVLTSALAPDLFLTDAGIKRIEYKDITFERVLGEGGAGVVYRGRLPGGDAVAVKKLKLDEAGEATGTGSRSFTEFRREVVVLNHLRHPNIVELRGVCTHPLCAVTEFIDCGDLFTHAMDTARPLPHALGMRVALDVCNAMSFMHSLRPPLLHRDLKSPNVLLAALDERAKVVAKVADFGLAGLASTINLAVDNPVWLAPEVIRKEEPTLASDVYSFGVVMWEIFARRQFFGDEPFMTELERKVVAGERPELPSPAPPACASLIPQCWANDPDDRPTFARVVWELYDEIKKDFPQVYAPPPSVSGGDRSPRQQRVARSARKLPRLSAAKRLTLRKPLEPQGGLLPHRARPRDAEDSPPLPPRDERRKPAPKLKIGSARAPLPPTPPPRVDLTPPSPPREAFARRGPLPPTPVQREQSLPPARSPVGPRCSQLGGASPPRSSAPAGFTSPLHQRSASSLPQGSRTPPPVPPKPSRLVSHQRQATESPPSSSPSPAQSPVGSPVLAARAAADNTQLRVVGSLAQPSGAQVCSVLVVGTLIWAGHADGSLTLWDPAKCAAVSTRPRVLADEVRALAISGLYVFASGGDRLAVLRQSTAAVVRVVECPTFGCWAQQLKTIWGGCVEDRLCLIDIQQALQPPRVVPLGAAGSVYAMAAGSGAVWAAVGDCLLVYDAVTCEKRHAIAVADAVCSIAKVAGKMWTGSHDGTISVWRRECTSASKPLASFAGHASAVTALLSLDDVVVSGSADGVVRAWNARDQSLLCKRKMHDCAVSSVLCVSINSGGGEWSTHRRTWQLCSLASGERAVALWELSVVCSPQRSLKSSAGSQ